MIANIVIFDTSVFIDHLRTNCHKERIQAAGGLLRTSSVVLAELWRGAVAPAELRFLDALARNHPILTPTESNWLESGRLLSKLNAGRGLTAAKLRDLHFDTLIALTARAHGARLITSDRKDFELIREYRNFQLEVWPAP